jgi:WD40 repeat protein
MGLRDGGCYPEGIHTDKVAEFLPGGRRAVSADLEAIVVWDLESGQCLRRDTVKPHPGTVLSPNRRFLLSTFQTGEEEQTLGLWDIQKGKLVRPLGQGKRFVSSMAFCPDGRRAVTADAEGHVQIWDAATGKLAGRFRAAKFAINALAVSPDGRRLLTSGWDKAIGLWDLRTGQELRRFEGHTEAVKRLAFSPGGRYAVSCGLDSSIRLWGLPR